MTYQSSNLSFFQGSWLRKIGALTLLTLGFLLSPLSFWNDLFFNLPLAYAFGYFCSWFSPSFLLPGTIAGYWLSNLIGLLLMQLATTQLLQKDPQENNLKKALWSGLWSSSAFTAILLLLVQFKVLDLSSFATGDFLMGFSSFFPN